MAGSPPPRWLVRLNTALLRAGLRVGSQYLLTVPGRRSGIPRSTPVSVASVDGGRYIVGAFADADWIANVRAAGAGTLARGGRVEMVSLSELAASARAPILLAFLDQVRGGRRFFGGQSPAEVAAGAERYPVFEVVGRG